MTKNAGTPAQRDASYPTYTDLLRQQDTHTDDRENSNATRDHREVNKQATP